MRRPIALGLRLALVVTSLIGSVHFPALAEVTFHPPVDGPIVDPWRPGQDRYSAGNRGVDFASVVGEPVRAVAGGVVSFSGQVGGLNWVVIRHDGNLRSSVGALADLLVKSGQLVAGGEIVGRAAATSLHFGLRDGDKYIDPTSRFRAVPKVPPTVPPEVPPSSTPGTGLSRVRLTR